MGRHDVWMLAVLMTVATETRAEPRGAQSTPVKAYSVPELLQASEAWIRPSNSEEKRAAGAELWTRGFADSAKLVYSPPRPDDAAFIDAATLLFRMGEWEAAHVLLAAWERRASSDSPIAVFRSVFAANQGDAVLALRELERIPAQAMVRQSALVQVARDIFRAQSRGDLVGTTSNPWGIRFELAESEYKAGAIPEGEQTKVTPVMIEGLSQLISLMPRQGNLWALLGELVNATGQPLVALECLRRAEESLEYRPAELRAHRRVLQAHAREVAATADRAINANLPPAAPNVAQEPPNLLSESRTRVVLIMGGIVVVVLVVLQVKEWLRRPPSR